MPPSAGEEIRAAISGAGGAIPFERFMQLSLYGAGGFYASGGTAGRRGDFLTSPEVGPLFGAVIARWLDATWVRLGRPGEFTVVDAGAGPGTLARAIRAAAPSCLDAMRYIAVEVSASQRAAHPAGIDSVESMPAGPFVGVVIANELLDNLAFRLVVFDGGWKEAWVANDRQGRFVEVLQPCLADDGVHGILPATAAHGARAPLQQRAASWMSAALGSLEAGTVIVLDYAAPTTAMLAARPWREWLRTYRSHSRGGHYLADPGSQDITTEVALDQLFAAVGEPDTLCSQQQFLQRWGIDALVDDGRRSWSELGGPPTLAALTMRSRVREAEALCDPAGLGAFTVTEFVRGQERPR